MANLGSNVREIDMAHLTFLDRFLIPNYFKPRHIASGLMTFDRSKCNGCGICARICPSRCLIMSAKGPEGKRRPPRLAESAPNVTMCIACADCQAACPQAAIRVQRGFEAKLRFRKLSQSPEMKFPKKY